MKGRFFLLLVLLGIAGEGYANNIRIPRNPQINGFASPYEVIIEFPLAWDNAWHAQDNWDAAYVFIKYRRANSGEPWYHAYLQEEGHTGLGGVDCASAKTGNNVVGTFVRLNKVGSSGNVNATVRIKWDVRKGSRGYRDYYPYYDALTPEMYLSGQVEIAVFGIEMVYVPSGDYDLGDNFSRHTFATAYRDDLPARVRIVSENAVTFKDYDDATKADISVPAAFPKGHHMFYTMKYELSQKQYVAFLNNLTYSQQKARIGNNLDNMTVGDYAFGAINEPSSRNGIVLVQKVGGSPVVFGHDLDHDGIFNQNTDGENVACNFVTPSDMLAYCDWAGLRPMTEMEYEKACRQILEKSVSGAFAWGMSGNIGILSGLTNAGTALEAPDMNSNVNAENGLNGPARCGLFARPGNTSQSKAGGTFWGIMDMSGNLAELCYNVHSGSSFSGNSGDGNLSTSTGWPSGAASFATRGGSYKSTSEITGELTISNRERAIRFPSGESREPDVTFRAARTAEAEKLDVDNTIELPNRLPADTTMLCAGCGYKITGSDLPNSVVWEKETSPGVWAPITGDESGKGKDLICDELFSNTDTADLVVNIRRRVVEMGENGGSSPVTLVVLGKPVIMELYDGSSPMVEPWGGGPLNARVHYPGKLTWKTESGHVIVSAENVTSLQCYPRYSDFTQEEIDLMNANIYCEYEVNGCKTEESVMVGFDSSVGNCVPVADKNDPAITYNTMYMPDGNCWMTENLRYKGNPDVLESGGMCFYNWDILGTEYSVSSGLPSDICPEGYNLAEEGELVDLLGFSEGMGIDLSDPLGFNLQKVNYYEQDGTTVAGNGAVFGGIPTSADGTIPLLIWDDSKTGQVGTVVNKTDFIPVRCFKYAF